jgi:hypothetical protein
MVDDSTNTQMFSYVLIAIVIGIEVVVLLFDICRKGIRGEPLIKVSHHGYNHKDKVDNTNFNPVVWHYVFITFGTVIVFIILTLATLMSNTTWVDNAIDKYEHPETSFATLERTYFVTVYMVWAGVLACMACGFAYTYATESWLFPKTYRDNEIAPYGSYIGKGLSVLVLLLSTSFVVVSVGFSVAGLITLTDDGSDCKTGNIREIATCNNRNINLWSAGIVAIVAVMVVLVCLFCYCCKPMRKSSDDSKTHSFESRGMHVPFSMDDQNENMSSNPRVLPHLNMRD